MKKIALHLLPVLLAALMTGCAAGPELVKIDKRPNDKIRAINFYLEDIEPERFGERPKFQGDPGSILASSEETTAEVILRSKWHQRDFKQTYAQYLHACIKGAGIENTVSYQVGTSRTGYPVNKGIPGAWSAVIRPLKFSAKKNKGGPLDFFFINFSMSLVRPGDKAFSAQWQQIGKEQGPDAPSDQIHIVSCESVLKVLKAEKYID